MRPTRRTLLGLLLAAPLPLSACSPSPVVEGVPAPPFTPEPTKPVQSPEARAAAQWIVDLDALARAMADDEPKWAEAVSAQCAEQLARLLAVDPLVPDREAVFDAPPGTIEVPGNPEAKRAAVEGHLDAGVEIFRGLTSGAGTQPERMLYASLAVAARGAKRTGTPPRAVGGSPIRFPETTLEASLGVALTHVWALIQALEFGIARFPAGKNRDRATSRLASAQALRDLLRDTLQDDLPAQAAGYEMPNDMSDEKQIRAALAELEGGVLDALIRAVASGGSGDDWFDRTLAQVSRVQDWGGRLAFWPGWAEVT